MKNKNSALDELLDNIKQEEQSEKLNLESFLIKPLQRVTKYPLLLKVSSFFSLSLSLSLSLLNVFFFN